MNQTYPQPGQPATAVKCFSAQRVKELIVTPTLVWWRKALTFLTLYDELSSARTPEGFAAVRVRLQQQLVLGSPVQSGLLSKFHKTGTGTGLQRLKDHEKLD